MENFEDVALELCDRVRIVLTTWRYAASMTDQVAIAEAAKAMQKAIDILSKRD